MFAKTSRMPSETIQQLLRERATSDAIAVKYGDDAWTWREHLRDASARAAALLALVDRDRPVHIGVLLGNTPEFLNQMAAAGLGGYVLCGINTTRRGDALAADIARADCQIVVTDAEHRTLLDGLDLGASGSSTRPARTGRELLEAAGELTPHREVEPLDTFMMIFTSGTSGDPKAVQGVALHGADVGCQAWCSSSTSPPTTPATCRCRCSTPMRWWRAGGWRSRPARRWRPRSSRRRVSSTTSAATAPRT